MTCTKPSPPQPFDKEDFELVRTGIYDDRDTAVFVNKKRDFAMLWPMPEVDYSVYTPRRSALKLDAYRRQEVVATARLEKLAAVLRPHASFLEIGASEGAFLNALRNSFPSMELASQDTDIATKKCRESIVGQDDYSSLEELVSAGRKFDFIGFFHVLEHITHPEAFLRLVGDLLAPGGKMVIEVPSFYDPLMKLYGGVEPWHYRDFFFQKQHPYYYSPSSLTRLLEFNGFEVSKTISHQRYGLENHLGWLVNGKPGGGEVFREVFGEVEQAYKQALEQSGQADAVIAVAAKFSASTC